MAQLQAEFAEQAAEMAAVTAESEQDKERRQAQELEVRNARTLFENKKKELDQMAALLEYKEKNRTREMAALVEECAKNYKDDAFARKEQE